MNNFSIAVHGGAGEIEEFVKLNEEGYKASLAEAIEIGYKILRKGGHALDAVEETVRYFERNLLFNCGRGTALNNKGEIEMCASIMDGKKLKAGAVSVVKNAKHPVTLARFIMKNTNHILLSAEGALELADEGEIELEPNSYFVTDHQVDAFLKARDKDTVQDILEKRVHGTVGAVALDKKGNLAAATSTGGTPNALTGRTGDSALIGAGCYANNETCAVSGTGDGEILISHVIANSISWYKEMTKCSMQEACDYIIHTKCKKVKGDVGVISVAPGGEIGIAFNSERMHRAWIGIDGQLHVHIYK
jgi:beta-aspartyl-peptidase (threonine type)